MGSPGRKRKDYVMRSAPVSKAVANMPPGYRFQIDDVWIDFEPYKQVDDKAKDIAWGFAVVMWRKRNDLSGTTASNHLRYLDRFFEHLSGEVGLFTLESINQSVVNYFAYWMKHIAAKRAHEGDLSQNSRRMVWGTVRNYLNDLMRYGMINHDIDLPTHVFDSNLGEQFEPYSQDEVNQIVAACRHDIRLLRRGERITEDGRYTAYISTLVPHALMVLLRTGLNPEVMFEMEVTEYSLKPSHLLHSTRLILPVKNRSGRSMNIELTEDTASSLRVKNNVVRLLEEVEQLTQAARESLSQDDPLRRKLWLVLSDDGRVDILNKFQYPQTVRSFAARHNILDRKGEMVALNLRRFRPTFAEAMLKISGGDIRDLQKRLGHAHIRTTMGYLDPNLEERKEAFQYSGKAMVDWALNGSGEPSLSEIAEQLDVTLDAAEKLANGDFNMAAAKCKDPFDSPLKGVKKGELCTEYLACFRCGNCVVLKEDSHRLFSFYHWLTSKKAVLGVEKWQATYGWVIDIINNDIAPQLGDEKWVAEEKRKAKEAPFPMWPAANDADLINTEGLA